MYLVNVNFYFYDFPCINIDCDQTKRRLWCYFSILAKVSCDLFFNTVKPSQIAMEKVLKCPWSPEGKPSPLPGHDSEHAETQHTAGCSLQEAEKIVSSSSRLGC